MHFTNFGREPEKRSLQTLKGTQLIAIKLAVFFKFISNSSLKIWDKLHKCRNMCFFSSSVVHAMKHPKEITTNTKRKLYVDSVMKRMWDQKGNLVKGMNSKNIFSVLPLLTHVLSADILCEFAVLLHQGLYHFVPNTSFFLLFKRSSTF